MNKLIPVLATAGLLLAATPAQAAEVGYAQTITDPVGDVVAEDVDVSNVPVSRAVGIAGGADASSVRVSHTASFVTAQIAAPNVTDGTRVNIDLRGSGRTYSFSWRFAEYRNLYRVNGDGALLSCATTVNRTFGTTDRIVVKIPSSCLGDPATVGARATISTGRTTGRASCKDEEIDFEGRCTDPVGTGRDPSGTSAVDARWTSFLPVRS